LAGFSPWKYRSPGGNDGLPAGGQPRTATTRGASPAALILPLSIPALIFGAGAVGAVDTGISTSGHFSLLGALLIITSLVAPPATAVALRIALE